MALLGLIWATGQIIQRALSAREKLSGFVNSQLVAWAIFVGLAYTTIPVPLSYYLIVIITVLFGIYLAWYYSPKEKQRRKKSAVPSRSEATRFLRGDKIMFLSSCVLEVWSAYTLYSTGYFAGLYDAFESMRVILQQPPLPHAVTTIFEGIVLSSAGIVLGTFGFVLVAYSRGRIRERKAKHRLT